MAFFERLGHRPVGIDDSAGPLRVARAHAPALPLVRGDALLTPFRSASFDIVFSAYVAEHFEDGPDHLLREAHRLLKPDGLLLLTVPYENLFRRVVTHPLLRAYAWLARRRGQALAFTEYRFARAELDALLPRCGFRIEHVEPDDYRFPWAKGLGVDLAGIVTAPGAWELNRAGRVLARLLSPSPWWACAGVFYVARAVK
jgi:SAM-dependent methyltransferase